MKTYIDEVVDKVANKLTEINSPYLLRVYALLVLTKGESITSKDVHDAWAMDMNFRPKTGDCYGHDHPCIVPFKELSTEIQLLDDKYVRALIEVAKELKQEK